MAFGDDIRTIARTAELQQKIDKAVKAALAAEKAAIKGERAIAYLTTQNGVTVGNGGKGETPAEDKKEDDQDKKEPNDKDEIGEDPDKDSEREDDPNGTNKEKLADKEGAGDRKGEQLLPPEGSEDGQNNKAGTKDQVRNVIVKDTDDNDMVLNLDGSYRKPNGWDGPNEPPPAEGWELGFYWATNTGTISYMAWPLDYVAQSAAIVSQNLGAPGQTGAPGDLFGPNSFGNYYLYLDTSFKTTDTYATNMQQADSGGAPIGPPFEAFETVKNECGMTPPPGAVEACSLVEPPTQEEFWPVVGNYILAFIDGFFTPNQYDSEVPPGKQPVNTVNFKMEDGRFGRIEPANNGGTIMYETTGPQGSTPLGSGVLFRGNGTIEAFVPSTQINSWIPNRPS